MVFAGMLVSEQHFPGEEDTAQRSQLELSEHLEETSWKWGVCSVNQRHLNISSAQVLGGMTEGTAGFFF